MSLFSRRSIQKCLDENLSFMAREQVDAHAQRLNQGNRQSIAAEWEVVLLNALSRIGTIAHEPDFGLGSKPDVYVRKPWSHDAAPHRTESRDSLVKRLSTIKNRLLCSIGVRVPEDDFVADITTVSDEAIERENPYEYFREELVRVFKKRGLTIGGLHIRVNGKPVGPEYRDRKMKLHLPPKNEIQQFIKEDFGGLIDAIAGNPNVPHSAKVQREGIDVAINYDPKERQTVFGGYPSFNVPYSRTRNPLANALKSKAAQLRKVKYRGTRGIICCDGGCGIFRKSIGGAMHVDHKEIVAEFFRRNTAISFVALVWVVEEGFGILRKQTREVQTVVYLSRVAKRRLTNMAYRALLHALKSLPQPIRTAINAMAAVNSDPYRDGASYYGGWNMAGTQQMKLSSRTLTELLAGRISLDQFFEDHGPEVRNFFNHQIVHGRMITHLSVESGEPGDDDWLVLKYGADPAVSAFRTRLTKE